MVNTCVCCGDTIPEGTQLCYACNNRDILICPYCGYTLRLRPSRKMQTSKEILCSNLYTCAVCNADLVSGQLGRKRHNQA